MKKVLTVILIGILTACNNSESSTSNVAEQSNITNVQHYYFPFSSDPTIYEYDDVKKGPYDSITREKSYIKFGFINESENECFLASYDKDKQLGDSITVIKNSDGIRLKSYSFLDENGGRTVAQVASGDVFPFSRSLNDNSTYAISYTTSVMDEMAKGNVSTSFSFQGITTSPNSTSVDKDCIKFISKLNVSLASMESSNTMEFRYKSTIYDKKNLGLYHRELKNIDGSIETRTFSRIVNASDW